MMNETGRLDEGLKMSGRENKAGGNTAPIAPDSIARSSRQSRSLTPPGQAASGQPRSTAATMLGDSIMLADVGSGAHQTVPLYELTSKEHRERARLIFTPTEDHLLRGLRESPRIEEQVRQRIEDHEALKAKEDEVELVEGEKKQNMRRPN